MILTLSFARSSHSGHRLAHARHGLFGVGARTRGGGRGLLGIVGGAFHRRGDFIEGGCGFLETGGLLLGALGADRPRRLDFIGPARVEWYAAVWPNQLHGRP
ncbi:hypothetical protein ACRAWD_22365 [Caulobacter segnis]